MEKARTFERIMVALSLAVIIAFMHGCGGNKNVRNEDVNRYSVEEKFVYNYNLEKEATKYKVSRGMNTQMRSGWEIVVERCVKDIDKSVTCYINVFNHGKTRNFEVVKDGTFIINDYDYKIWAQQVKATRHGLFRDKVESNEVKLFKVLFLEAGRISVADLQLTCDLEGEGMRKIRFSAIPIDRDF